LKSGSLNLLEFSGPLQACDGIALPLGKGKAIPLQTGTGPEGSRRFRLPDFKTIGT